MNVDELEFVWLAEQDLFCIRYFAARVRSPATQEHGRLAVMFASAMRGKGRQTRVFAGVIDGLHAPATFLFSKPGWCQEAQICACDDLATPFQTVVFDEGLAADECEGDEELVSVPFGISRKSSGEFYVPVRRGHRHAAALKDETIENFKREFEQAKGALADWARFRIATDEAADRLRLGPCHYRFRADQHVVKVSMENAANTWGAAEDEQAVRRTFNMAKRRTPSVEIELPPDARARDLQNEIVFVHIMAQRAHEEQVNEDRKRAAQAAPGGSSAATATRPPLLNVDAAKASSAAHALPNVLGRDAQFISLASAIKAPANDTGFQAVGFRSRSDMTPVASLAEAGLIKVWFWRASYVDLVGVAVSSLLQLRHQNGDSEMHSSILASSEPRAEFMMQANPAALSAEARDFIGVLQTRVMKRLASQMRAGDLGEAADSPPEHQEIRKHWIDIATGRPNEPLAPWVDAALSSPFIAETVVSCMRRMGAHALHLDADARQRMFLNACVMVQQAPVLGSLGLEDVFAELWKVPQLQARPIDTEIGVVDAVLNRLGLGALLAANATDADRVAIWNILKEVDLPTFLAQRNIFIDAGAAANPKALRQALRLLQEKNDKFELYDDFVRRKPEFGGAGFTGLAKAYKTAVAGSGAISLSDALALADVIRRIEDWTPPPPPPPPDPTRSREKCFAQIIEDMGRIERQPEYARLFAQGKRLLERGDDASWLELDEFARKLRDGIGQNLIVEKRDDIISALAAWGNGDDSGSSSAAPEVAAAIRALQDRAFHFRVPDPNPAGKLEFDRWRASVRGEIARSIDLAAKETARPVESETRDGVIEELSRTADVVLHARAQKLIRGALAGDAPASDADLRRALRLLELWPQESAECWEFVKKLTGARLSLSTPLAAVS
ncbi:MAG: hypothetical protein U1E19_10750 [Rhodoblastus sp.]